jgi:squalene-hopene/tetraprenyl-beta-curcumene cyclase
VTTTGDDRTAATWNTDGQLAAATTAVQRASRLLLARQDSQGWWSGRPEGEIALDAEGLMIREFLGIRAPEQTKAVAQQIRSLQRTDGSWTGSGEPGRTGSRNTSGRSGPPDLGEPGYASDLSASVLAYLALRLAGDSPDTYHMAVAAGWIRDAGGLAATALSVQVWLAIFGLTEWHNIPVPLPEVIYLPAHRSAGLGVWPDWSRPALISLAVTGALRPVRRLPFNLGALRVPGPAAPLHADDWRLRVGQRGMRIPPMSVARSVARTCGRWLAGWQQRDEGRALTRSVWPGSVVALYLLGYPLDHPVMADGLAWLDSVAPRLRPPVPKPHSATPRRPPVRDTALAIGALADSGLGGEHPALAAAGRWLLSQQVGGSASGPRTQADPAPCGWSFRNDGYPNVGDTARVLLALGRIRLPGLAGHPAITDALRWLVSMQGRDGGWGCSAAVTGLAIHALARHALAVRELAVQELAVQEPASQQLPGEAPALHPRAANGPAASRAVRRGVVFLLNAQRANGSWPAGPGESDLYATATVLPTLVAAGVLPGKPAAVEAAQWLIGRQNLDAGWASGPGQPAGRDGRAPSDAPGTARALTALLSSRGPDSADPVDLGVDWLVRGQQADGGWSERPAGRHAPRNRGNIVPGLLSPLSALGQYVTGGGSWADRAPSNESVADDRIARADRTPDRMAAAAD